MSKLLSHPCHPCLAHNNTTSISACPPSFLRCTACNRSSCCSSGWRLATASSALENATKDVMRGRQLRAPRHIPMVWKGLIQKRGPSQMSFSHGFLKEQNPFRKAFKNSLQKQRIGRQVAGYTSPQHSKKLPVPTRHGNLPSTGSACNEIFTTHSLSPGPGPSFLDQKKPQKNDQKKFTKKKKICQVAGYNTKD